MALGVRGRRRGQLGFKLTFDLPRPHMLGRPFHVNRLALLCSQRKGEWSHAPGAETRYAAMMPHVQGTLGTLCKGPCIRFPV